MQINCIFCIFEGFVLGKTLAVAADEKPKPNIGGTVIIPDVYEPIKGVGLEKIDSHEIELFSGSASFPKVLDRKWPKESKYFISIEVHPCSHGIETVGGVMETVIPRVFEGKANLTKDCRQMGSFELSGIPPAPRGVPQIEVTFESVDGRLHVIAKDKATNKSQVVMFNAMRQETERVVKEAEEFEKNRQIRERNDARKWLERLYRKHQKHVE
ncbi:hypothetical protein ACH5RR_022950 [Cinchona calisaya]|uniref:Uncharacterized protein n=1 Tax=Cinchona calisaya TaxID=153742 RepID=A0ABD2ZE78_9GENT